MSEHADGRFCPVDPGQLPHREPWRIWPAQGEAVRLALEVVERHERKRAQEIADQVRRGVLLTRLQMIGLRLSSAMAISESIPGWLLRRLPEEWVK